MYLHDILLINPLIPLTFNGSDGATVRPYAKVPVTADTDEVKKHFRKKMLLVHPDKNGGAPHSNEAFDRVKQASAVGGGGKKKNKKKKPDSTRRTRWLQSVATSERPPVPFTRHRILSSRPQLCENREKRVKKEKYTFKSLERVERSIIKRRRESNVRT